VSLTREDWYRERIAHLRSGVEILGETINERNRMLGLPDSGMAKILLDNDTERGLRQDRGDTEYGPEM
jgi:hypothetical protein